MGSAETKLIFVIEDDDAVRGSTGTLLEALGFAVREFASAEEFLAATEGRGGDCLVLDHYLPGMSGLALLDLLRARGVKTPAIVISANGARLTAQAARAGAVAVLRKPLTADALEHWLEQIFP